MIDKEEINKLSKKYGSPFFLINEAKIKGNIDRFRKSFSNYKGKFTLGYSTKTNPQVGILKRVFVCQDFSDESKETFLTMINPKIIDTEGRVESKEGCLSIPGYYDYVYRAEKIQIEALDINGKSKIYLTDGMQSIVFQHEYDHLDGILFPYRMSQIKRDIFMKKINREFK